MTIREKGRKGETERDEGVKGREIKGGTDNDSDGRGRRRKGKENRKVYC